MFCTTCGAQAAKPGKFCAECGALLGEAASPPPPPPPPDWAGLPQPAPPPLDDTPPPPPTPPLPATSKGGGLGLLVRLIALAAVAALIVGAVLAWPQISKQLGIAQASASPQSSGPDASASTEPTEEPSGLATAEPSEDPTLSPTEEPSDEPTEAPSFLTGGHPKPEGAIGEFVESGGYVYGGPCETATTGDYCAGFVSDSGDDLIYAVGPLASEVEVWVLLRQIDGEWYIAEVAKAEDGPAPW